MMRNNSKTFAIFGNPVAQSLSPLMHNAAFNKMKINARYMAICIKNVQDVPVKIEEMNIKGASITIPHKTAVMEYLDEISDSSGRIGAVNTINCSDGKLMGDNTDWTGLILALKESMEIRGGKFAILGAGGAARAAVYGILKEGGMPVVLNRTIKKGEKVAKEFGCEFYPIAEIGKIKGDCLINTTPVGMFPDMEKSPASKAILQNFRWVMDIIYNPLKTKLLKDAEEAGCRTISGVSMFVHQGAEQLRIWTGLKPPVDFMKKIVVEKLRNERN